MKLGNKVSKILRTWEARGVSPFLHRLEMKQATGQFIEGRRKDGSQKSKQTLGAGFVGEPWQECCLVLRS